MADAPDLIVRNIGLLATPLGCDARGGDEQGRIGLLRQAYLSAGQGRITDIGLESDLDKDVLSRASRVIDAGGALVTPGLVDCHTHLVFAGWRQRELALKLKGCGYLDILKQGGGILSTVRNTREATMSDLVRQGRALLKTMGEHGTTTCEIKSGYGLTVEDELKSLRAVRELVGLQFVELAPTFMGAHALPAEFSNDKKGYVSLLCERMLPAVAGEGLAEFCDVFCEDGAFTVEEARAILGTAREYGLHAKVHADEITDTGGACLAAEVKAISAEHLIHADDIGLKAMSAAGVIAVLLPGTSFYLGEDFARAGRMKELGIPIAVATDFNPGSSPNESLQLPMTLACLKYRLTPEEVLTAVTLNAAAAIDRASSLGTLEVGKQADLVIWQASDLEFIFYRYGVNLVRTVVKRGRVVVERTDDNRSM